MTCPNSGEPLEQGKAKIHVTPLNFFKVGFSIQHFLSNQSPKKNQFSNSGSPDDAWSCKAYELIILKNRRKD